jgi:hypothetical protein
MNLSAVHLSDCCPLQCVCVAELFKRKSEMQQLYALIPSISRFCYVNFLSCSINSSVSGGGGRREVYIIEVDGGSVSGVAVSICCQNRSGRESP